MRDFKTFKWHHHEFSRDSKPIKLSTEQRDSLFEHLERRLNRNSCDHTLKYSIEWVKKNQLEPNTLLTYFHRQGGYCDCEVILNFLLK